MKRISSLFPLLAAAAVVSLTVSAAFWQLSRGREKDRMAADIEAANAAVSMALGDSLVTEASARFRRVVAIGRFEPRALVLADNQVQRQRAGYHVYMPLLLSGSNRAVLVNRGWIAAGPDRGVLPTIATPQDEVRIEGIALPANRRFVELSSEAPRGPVWQNVTLERFAAAHPMALHGFVLEQHGGALDDGLVRDWPRPESGAAKHYGYAFQWAALSVLTIFLTVFFHVRRSLPETPPA
ncbi:MAG: SURF1 family protein [Betaproteobacteria bacterium]